jgi:hypothetical protein
MAIPNDHVYLSEVNMGEAGLEVTTMQPFGTQSSTGVTLIFNRENLQFSEG